MPKRTAEGAGGCAGGIRTNRTVNWTHNDAKRQRDTRFTNNVVDGALGVGRGGGHAKRTAEGAGGCAGGIRTNRTVNWTHNDADRPLTETIAGGTLVGWSVVGLYNDKLQRAHQRLREGGTTR